MTRPKPTAPAPIETKVKAAAAGGAATLLVSQILLKFLPVLKDLDQDALGKVLDVVVTTGLGALGAYVAGWKARHTPRPDLEPPAASGPTLVAPTAPPVPPTV